MKRPGRLKTSTMTSCPVTSQLDHHGFGMLIARWSFSFNYSVILGTKLMFQSFCPQRPSSEVTQCSLCRLKMKPKVMMGTRRPSLRWQVELAERLMGYRFHSAWPNRFHRSRMTPPKTSSRAILWRRRSTMLSMVFSKNGLFGPWHRYELTCDHRRAAWTTH